MPRGAVGVRLAAAGLLALLGAPGEPQDRCLLGCDEVTAGAAVRERLAARIDVPLPAGVEVVGVVEGGFQDAFLQARMDLPAAAVPLLVRALGGDAAELGPRDGEAFGPPGPAWWDAEARDLRVGRGDLNAYDWTLIGVAEGGDAATLYLWAFQT